VNILTGLVAALLIFVLFILSLNWITHHGSYETVPNVTGKTFEEAQKILEKSGFEVIVQDSVYVDTLGPSSVIRQVPDGDAVVKVNRNVYLTINRTVPPTVEMPNLIGYSYRNAEMVLKNMGLRVGDTTSKPDFAKNSVLEQRFNGSSIAPGTKLQMGNSISLVLGSGVGETEFGVPQLVGMTFGQAKSMLEANGLSMGAVVAEGITDTTNAYIYKQDPPQYDDEKRRIHIRTGQMMSVWLQVEKPVMDTAAQSPIQTPQ
jgi:eukaryotic-like serine/threonine-protein kinase